MTQLFHLPSFFASWQTQWSSDLRFLRWVGQWPGAEHGVERFAWNDGPFPLELPAELSGTLGGATSVIDVAQTGMPMLVPSEWGPVQIVGPWRVTIRGLDERRPERRVLATWTMHWVRVAPVQSARWITSIERVRFGAHEKLEYAAGASEARSAWGAGASEAWRLGASERMWLGASEWMLMGASEWVAAGASELALMGLGASGLLARGASEWLLLGASERLLGGGSEWRGMGSSGGVGLGASEGFAFGSSDSVGSWSLGASSGPSAWGR
jgi:hypothetical protein